MNSSPLLDRLARKLDERRAAGLLRALPEVAPSAVIDCSTNSYLGLHADLQVAREAAALAAGRLHGNLAARLVAESNDLARQMEHEIADWEGTEEALVFGSGYAANLGILQALCNRATEVFCDWLNHASIYDGIKLAGCKLTRYRHCDMDDLRRRLQTSTAPEKLIVTDTVFSMDGDRAPLADIADLARTHHAMVMVDEAHAAGLFGQHGSGLVEATGTASAIAVRMGTLSKAVAGLGGYVACSALLRDAFVNLSRSFVYSTGLPPVVLAHDLAAIRRIRTDPTRGAALLAAASEFRADLARLGFSTGDSTTQIVPCLIGDEQEATRLSQFLREHDILVPAIRPPTVPKGTARLRFSWTSLLTEDHRAAIVAALAEWQQRHVSRKT
jgi:8-amino-7-oxononanoate synthase